MEAMEPNTRPDYEALRGLITQWVHDGCVPEPELEQLEEALALSEELRWELRRRLRLANVVIAPDTWESCQRDPDRFRKFVEGRRTRPLTEEEWEFLYLRMGFDRGKTRSLEEMAQLLDITRERVRYKENRILRSYPRGRSKPIRDFYV